MAQIEACALRLPDFLESELVAGHPWVYRNHIPSEFKAPTGSWVCAQAGRTKIWALWDNESQIALRVFSRYAPPSVEFVFEKVQLALKLRQTLNPTRTTAYRLVNGEGDGLPGIVVDVYGEFAVVATYCEASRVLIPQLVDALTRSLAPRGIIHKQGNSEPGERAQIELLFGIPPPDDLVVSEGEVRYYADLAQGHKTGLYLDQRDNRHALARFTKAGTLLNLFSYTGGFSVVSARAGALRTTNIDISEPALNRARDNFILNGLDPNEHQFTVADCYDYLKLAVRSRSTFDSVVCDPPSLARNRAQLDHALKAYLHVNALGLQLVRAGGYYAAASCTAQVSPEQFRQILSNATQRAGRNAQIVHDAGHAIDHPIGIGHPEGRYLKFVVLRLLNEPR